MSEAFVEKLRAHGNKRVPLEKLRTYFAEACPELAHAPDRSALLLRLLHQLHDEQRITLPAKGSWERIGNPLMPKFVVVAAEAEESVDYRSIAWLPVFGFWVQLNSVQLRDAALINDFLKKHPGPLTPIPLNERSLQIFGDEKRLSRMDTRGNALFSGRLPLVTIGAFHLAPPLPYRAAAAPGKPVLVVENHHTYWSVSHWNLQARHYAAVVYGSGNEFPKSGMLALDEVVKEVNAVGAEYFGDLDRAGIAIPYHFSRRRIEAGKTPVTPCIAFYAWLLDHGYRQPCDDIRPDRAELQWLGEELKDCVAGLLASGHRVAQESLAYDKLTALFPT